jgi:20S proteasome alpha/beta subunit
MTICVATLFRWNYGKPSQSSDWGSAALIMSDRRITTGDIEYEPDQAKFAYITNRAVVAIAGDLSLHSEAIMKTKDQVQGRLDTKPQAIASIYGTAIQSIKRRQAEDEYLAPLGLNTDTFLSQQNEYSDRFLDRIVDQLQQYRGSEVEALVVASDGSNVHIYHIDLRGTTNLMDDAGFASIGIGAWHARSRLMQAKYTNVAVYAKAVIETYAAKRAAETAPGISKFTDAILVLRNEIQPVASKLYDKAQELYERNLLMREAAERTSFDEFQRHAQEFAESLAQQAVPPEGKT